MGNSVLIADISLIALKPEISLSPHILGTGHEKEGREQYWNSVGFSCVGSCPLRVAIDTDKP